MNVGSGGNLACVIKTSSPVSYDVDFDLRLSASVFRIALQRFLEYRQEQESSTCYVPGTMPMIRKTKACPNSPVKTHYSESAVTINPASQLQNTEEKRICQDLYKVFGTLGNTSLHNPNVRDKPGLERFVAMNRGINEGGDLPQVLLRNLYDSIRNEPFKIPEDDGNDLTHTFFNPDPEGWLLKLGGRVKTWKRRGFILTDNCLYHSEYPTDKEHHRIIPLENLSIREVDDPRKPNCFELYIPNNKGQLIKACKTEAAGRVVEGNHMWLRRTTWCTVLGPTQEEKEEWIKSIQAAVSVDPFYEMLAARKKRISVKKKQEQPCPPAPQPHYLLRSCLTRVAGPLGPGAADPGSLFGKFTTTSSSLVICNLKKNEIKLNYLF
ncbi:LOW QUALITY PROTEIN: cytohesin-2-like [Leptonychotes weddellii]|uniref:LOW QUALITY PROTEIN: cytohesin-2-like n=1 Tax=Leptonychotes weddellii TaxID=9713 RepID=A0A7F8RQN6_LEPWE|nr:LOW QUALITY PROTEIN: cytohesin-2-like [Leptonychotes weddellii]